MIDRRGVVAAGLGLGLAGVTGCGEAASANGVMAQATNAPPLSPATRPRLDALIGSADSVGGMVVAVRAGRIIGFHPWGDARRKPDQPVTDRTLFHIGSNGKHFTALAVLQLVEAGRVRLDAPLGQYVRGLPPLLADVPVTHLLHQTSGLPDYVDHFPDWTVAQPRAAVLRAMRDDEAQFEPGAAWAYSNTNYLVLGWLIEDVSGQSYADHVRTRLFAPAGLPLARPDSTADPIPERAQPFTSEDGRLARAPTMEDAVSRAADGGVLFSAVDVGPWRAALDGHRLVSAASMALALSPGPLTTGRAAPYGMGYFLERTRGAPLYHHSGGVPGFASWWLTLPQAGNSVLAVTNSDGDAEAPLEDIALAMAEGVAPGSTFLGLPIQTTDDPRTAILRRAFREADADIPDRLLAPELIAVGAEASSWGISSDHEFGPVERWPVKGGEMVRYRWVGDDGETGHIVVGWTPENRIYWMY